MNYIKGVDRSHNNDPVALTNLVRQGVSFIFFKATQGLTYVDPAFDHSWKEAKGIPGLIRGAYHFFDGRFDGIAQAKHLLSQGIDFNAPGALPPVIDVEDLVGKNDTDSAKLNKWVADNRQIVLQRLHGFLDTVKADTGRDCIIYTYNNYMREYFHGIKFSNNPLWLSSLQSNAPLRYDTGLFPEFWQYTYRWNSTDMDGNYFIGSEDKLNILANINP